jgi:hypothetical protein
MSGVAIFKKSKSPPELIRQSNLRHQTGSKWGREEAGLATIHLQIAIDNGKPLARGGRKTTGLTESAGSPK